MRTVLTVMLTIDHECEDEVLLRMAVTSELAAKVFHYECTEMRPGNVEGETERCSFRISKTEDALGGTCDAGEFLPSETESW